MYTVNRRAAGTAFIAIAAFLHASRYVAAAIYGSNSASWGTQMFQRLLEYVSPSLSRFAIVSLISGLVYLLWAELGETNNTSS